MYAFVAPEEVTELGAEPSRVAQAVEQEEAIHTPHTFAIHKYPARWGGDIYTSSLGGAVVLAGRTEPCVDGVAQTLGVELIPGCTFLADELLSEIVDVAVDV